MIRFLTVLLVIVASSIAHVQLRFVADISTNLMAFEPTRYGIILGAGLQPDGSPSPVLTDRIAAGVKLYKEGKVKRLLITGDGRQSDDFYDEVAAMETMLLQNGVDSAAIVKDNEGTRTKISCDRAALNYGITDAIVVTQAFHMPRALFLCRDAGITVVGYVADQRRYTKQGHFIVREFGASLLAFFDAL